MKSKYLIPIIVTVGLVVLFFFPEPETNFLAYAGTALTFVVAIIFVILWQKQKKLK